MTIFEPVQELSPVDDLKHNYNVDKNILMKELNSYQTKNDIFDANERIKTACVNFERSGASMKLCAENLMETLSAVSENLNAEEE